MASGLPTKDQLHQQVVDGRPITKSEVTDIAHAESERSDAGPVKDGSAATAQSLYDKQQNVVEKAGEVARKYPGEITKQDAAEVQRAEPDSWVSVLARGSTSAQVQSLADQNAASIDKR